MYSEIISIHSYDLYSDANLSKSNNNANIYGMAGSV
jgi:hypothetical protein